MNSTKQQRQFFFLMAGVLAALGAFKFYRGVHTTGGILVGTGAALFLIEVTLPKVAQSLFKVWMKFAQTLGHINTFIIITVAFILVLSPIGFFRRVILGVKRKEIEGYRQKKSSFHPLTLDQSASRYASPF